MDNIGTLIKERRKFMSLSQTQLANRSKVSQASVSRLENGDETMALDQFLSLLNTLCIEISDVFPKPLKSDINEITHALDRARKHQDTTEIEKIINAHPLQFWCKSPELHIYLIWHEAIIAHNRGETHEAIQKIERIHAQYHNIPACYEILAEVLNNLGNIHTDLTKRLYAYIKAKDLYLNSTKSNYQTYIKILVNLSNTYCKKHNYKQSLRHVNTAYRTLREHESTYQMTSLIIIECNAYHFLKQDDMCLDKLTGARSFFEHANELDKWEIYRNLFTTE